MNHEPSAIRIECGDHAALAREIGSFIARNPNIFGGADIYEFTSGTPISRAGMLAAVLMGLVDQENRPAVRKFVIVAPPGTNPADAVEIAWAQFVESLELFTNRQLNPHEATIFKTLFNIEVAANRHPSSVTRIIEAQGQRTAIIVTQAASYRDDTIAPYIAPSALTPIQSEDIWAPQLHGLASAATELAREKALYVALDSDELSPCRQALSDLLQSIEGCGVIGSSSDDAPEAILAAHVELWDALIREGRLGEALRDLDALPTSLDRHKGYLRIQLLHLAGHPEHALQVMREYLRAGTDLSDSLRIKLAKIACEANASALASELLVAASLTLDSLEDLESALATAHEVRLTELEETIAARIGALFPDSARLRRRQLRQLAHDRNYAGAAIFARDKLGDDRVAKFYQTLDQYLSVTQVPDYHALMADAGGDDALGDEYRMASVSDALMRKLLVDAFEFAMPLPPTPELAQTGERLLLETLEALLLVSNKEGNLPVSLDRFQAAVLSLIERLAANPGNQALRVGLVELMQPNLAGSAGLGLIAVSVLQLASRPVRIRKGGALRQAGMDWLMEREPFLTTVFAWMRTEEPIVIGQSVLPANLLTEPADEVVSAIIHYLTHEPPGTLEDTKTMLLWLAFGAAVAPHSSAPDCDLCLIRLVAGKLASTGDLQQARDLAEQALINSTESAHRRRLGWFTMADVYARGGNSIEGLLAIACTLAADHEAEAEQVYQETVCVARLLRDCGLHDQARLAIGNARALLDQMRLHEENGYQLDTLELQLRQVSWKDADDPDAALTALLRDVVANGRDVISRHGLTAPVGALLGQLLRIAQQRGIDIPADAKETFKELQRYASGLFNQLVATMSAVRPTAQDLFAAAQALGPARYSDDVGFDMRNLAIAAGRALANDNLLADPEGVAFVLDLLADRGVALPGWDEAAIPVPPPAALGETVEIARSISRAGISVVQVGFDEDGRLVRLSTTKGRVGQAVREPDDIILEERLKQWRIKFPFSYGLDEDTSNLFYTTTADLRLSELPNGPVIISADASFQAFPPNLLFIDDNFAGRTRPMAAVPSLAWLGRAREARYIGNGQMCAWISTAADGESQTLSMIAERLRPTFEAYGLRVDNGPVLPTAFAGATLAVVTAHGGVHPEGRFFQVVSDEGMLRVTAADLANALRNIGVVVLFVCSGGRADKHPAANTTLGLAKQILDRGCSAVVASPWPIDARVPSHWLPAFLECWTQGATLIEANFRANQVVDQQFAQDPARGLAMTVYGNPELALGKHTA